MRRIRDFFSYLGFVLGLIWLIMNAGCAGTLERPAAPVNDVVYCRRLDWLHSTWGAVGKGAATLAGSGGLAVLPIDTDEKALRISVAGSALAFAALSVAALYASDGYAQSWARECVQPVPAQAGEPGK